MITIWVSGVIVKGHGEGLECWGISSFLGEGRGFRVILCNSMADTLNPKPRAC